tara:strand:+ start:62 stop:265 length:204 start_codon:yes stop_codon:yes gene_type:complete
MGYSSLPTEELDKLALKPRTLLQVMTSGMINVRGGAEKLPKGMPNKEKIIREANKLFKLILSTRRSL